MKTWSGEEGEWLEGETRAGREDGYKHQGRVGEEGIKIGNKGRKEGRRKANTLEAQSLRFPQRGAAKGEEGLKVG